MTPVYIGLGSNLGDRLARIQEAVGILGERLDLTAASPIYETAPMYVEDQPRFYNGVLAGATELGPLEVLGLLKSVEARVGRLPRDRYGPREIDLDLLVYGCARYRFEDTAPTRDRGSEIGDRSGDASGYPPAVLNLPHPRIAERRFVLQPLYDAAPGLVLPGLGSVKALLDATFDQTESVKMVTDAVLSLHR